VAERIEMTAEGKANLEAELKKLIEIEEPDLVKSLGEAAAQGDLRENFAYHDIRRQLGLMRGRIAELRGMTQSAVVIRETNTKDGKVRLGRIVVVKEEGYDEEEEYAVVTEAESINSTRDDGKNVISSSSPMGSVLMGKKAGDKINVRTPRGTMITFEIVKVS
jgi:transcription elongation factor GreA